jgi:hypothetical protein
MVLPTFLYLVMTTQAVAVELLPQGLITHLQMVELVALVTQLQYQVLQ